MARVKLSSKNRTARPNRGGPVRQASGLFTWVGPYSMLSDPPFMNALTGQVGTWEELGFDQPTREPMTSKAKPRKRRVRK